MSSKSAFMLSVISIIVAIWALWKAYTPEISITEKGAIGGNLTVMVEEAIIKKPEMIVNAITELTKKKEKKEMEVQKEEVAKHKEALFGDKDNPIAGNAEGDIKVVEFFDYRCGYCRRGYGPLHEAVKKDGKVQVIYKELPIFGGEPLLARAALAAHKQGRYDDFHRALMNSDGGADEEALETMANKLGLDVARWKTDMNDPEIIAMIERNKDLAAQLGISGTPTFIIGEDLYPGFLTVDQFHEAFKRARD